MSGPVGIVFGAESFSRRSLLGAVAAGASAWALYRLYKYGVAPWERVYTDAGVFPKKKVSF